MNLIFSDFLFIVSKLEQMNFDQVKRYAERKNLHAETKNAKKFAPRHWYQNLQQP